ncbi:MAG: site-specific DNA-methyltransferase [Ignavibacterium sp.]|nr:site-specific DNA-methyltransferase [Ignavibacterium sp.]MDW8375182.1 site-specific DNA-methyltransferase [Ignavibacteriales bacterium]
MLNKKPAPRNRTITLTKSEVSYYSKKLITLSEKKSLVDITNRTINQNLFDVIDFLPNNFVDLLFLDPPYNLEKKFNSTHFKEMNKNEYSVWMDSWLSKMVRLLKSTASIYICCDYRSSSVVESVASKYFKPRNRIVWEREKGRGASKNWKNNTEDIWFFTVSDKYTFNLDAVKVMKKVIAPYRENGKPKDWLETPQGNFRLTHPSNIWTDITVPFWSMPENTNHPTQKPEKLLAKIILASTNENDFVFDPFAGSGTTAVVAQKLGRKFLSIEIDKTFACLIEKRLELAEKDKSIQGYHNNIFWERNSLGIRSKLIKK